jgi:hypothetical protein
MKSGRLESSGKIWLIVGGGAYALRRLLAYHHIKLNSSRLDICRLETLRLDTERLDTGRFGSTRIDSTMDGCNLKTGLTAAAHTDTDRPTMDGLQLDDWTNGGSRH